MSFTTSNRRLPLWETVCYRDVPIFRALALALEHAAENGARFAIVSADRRDSVITKFNKQYGTRLHGQEYLFAHQHDPGFFAANRPSTSSHCLFADGNPAYRVTKRILPSGAKLPKHFLGIDAVDKGRGAKANDCSMLIGHLERLGYHVTRPYHTGGEAHHFVFVSDPTPVLRHWKRVPAQPAAAKPAPVKAKPAPVKAKPPPVKAKPKPQPKNAAEPTALSPAGAAFIAMFEGFRPKLYNDPAGHCTIGCGHLVHLGPINGKEPAEFKRGITRAAALKLLQSDATPAAAAVRSSVKVPLNQAQFDALVSFAFNLGTGALETSTLLKKLNAGNYAAVPKEFEKWVKAGGKTLPGLVRRRTAEADLFANGVYAET
jgi:lysozyme